MCPVDPLPELAVVTSPGFALASATSSASDFAGTLGWAATIIGARHVMLTGTKSFTGS